MNLLKQGADIHNNLNKGLITKVEAMQQRDRWWSKIEGVTFKEDMMFNLMMMYRCIKEKAQ